MAELNQFSLYSMGGNYNVQPKCDEVDTIVKELVSIDEYEKVVNFVREHFGDVHGNRLFEYDDINKQINVFTEENRVEICVAKDRKQYWGKGWLLPKSEK